MNVLKTLAQCGLVKSVRGVRGGYTLAVPAEQITLATLVEAVEGPLRLVRCVSVADEEDEHCELVDVCPIRIPVRKLHEKLHEFLDNVTIAELASEGHYVGLQLSGRELRATAP